MSSMEVYVMAAKAAAKQGKTTAVTPEMFCWLCRAAETLAGYERAGVPCVAINADGEEVARS